MAAPIGTWDFGTTTTTQTINTYANPSLQKCINARILTSASDTRAATEFDCAPTALDAEGRLSNAADRNFATWNDTLYYGKSTTPITGFYSKKGVRCAGLTAATKECPVAARAKFVVSCDTSDPRNFQNGKCALAKEVKTYRVVQQEYPTPGEKAIKTTVMADSSISNNTSIAVPVPMAAINASTKSAYKCADLQVAGNPPLFQKGVDQYGYPICEEDTTVNIMRDQICKQMMQNIWDKGGTSTTPCEIITVTKVFPLSGAAGTKYKTTEDCKNLPADTRKLYVTFNGAISEISNFNLSPYSGGKLSGAITNEATFKNKYGITSSAPPFTCKTRVETLKTNPVAPWSTNGSYNFTLPSDYVPGSLNVTVVGAGSGGGGSNNGSGWGGGAGGKAGNASINSNLYLAKKPGVTCYVSVGKGGKGGDPGSKTVSGWGTDTTIACSTCTTCGNNGNWDSGQAWVTGGPSVKLNGGADSGASGEATKLTNSVGVSLGGGGAGASCGMGGAATQPGAGGGGGGTKGMCSEYSGGGGADGYARVDSWKIFEWVDWTP